MPATDKPSQFVNGKPSEHLPISDRATAYGDGCFTTIAKASGVIQLLEAHIGRLQKGCVTLKIDFYDWDMLRQQVVDVSAAEADVVIKVLISRGSGGRGYSTVGADNPVSVISLHPFPKHYGRWASEGISISLNSVRLSKQPLLNGVKHLNRLEQVLAKNHVNDSVQEQIICDTDDMIVEVSSANIFWKLGKQWFTPDLSFSGVEGVMRNQWLAIFEQCGMKVNIVRAHYSVLNYVTDMFICNSLMPAVPVNKLCLNSKESISIASDIALLQQMMTKSLEANA